MTRQLNNKATLATYKDATIKVTYYSKTNTELSSINEVISEYFKPNSSMKYKIKLTGVDGAASIKIEFVSIDNI